MEVRNLRFSGKSNPEIPIFRKTKSGISDFRKTEIRNFRFSENEIRNFRFSPARVAKYSVFQHLKSGKSESRYYRDTIAILWAIQSQCRTHACSHIACVSRYGFPNQGGSQTEGVRGTRLDRAAVQLRMTKFAMPLDCILRNLRKCREYNEHVSEGVEVTTPTTNLDFGTQTLTIPFAG